MNLKYIKKQNSKNMKLNLQNKDYVDDIQTLIAPTTQQISKNRSEKNLLPNDDFINIVDNDDFNDDLIEDGLEDYCDLNLSEAELTLKKIKGNGKPIIGDFSSELGDYKPSNNTDNNYSLNDNKRKLNSVGDKKITMSNVYEFEAPNFENSFEDILSEELNKQEDNKHNVFADIKGIKKPIQIKSSEQKGLKDMLVDLEWSSGYSKKF